jgi:hypothetical protein
VRARPVVPAAAAIHVIECAPEDVLDACPGEVGVEERIGQGGEPVARARAGRRDERIEPERGDVAGNGEDDDVPAVGELAQVAVVPLPVEDEHGLALPPELTDKVEPEVGLAGAGHARHQHMTEEILLAQAERGISLVRRIDHPAERKLALTPCRQGRVEPDPTLIILLQRLIQEDIEEVRRGLPLISLTRKIEPPREKRSLTVNRR